MNDLLPKVTVVTITYNLIDAGRKETFLQCVESVKNQTYQNIEHIIIDGASTDGTLDLIKSTGLTYYSEPDDGIYYAMNKGIEKSTGKYIAFLNSDDYWHGKKGVADSVKRLEGKNADFCYAECLYIDEDDNPAWLFEPNLAVFFVKMPFSHQSMFVRKDVMLRLGMFDTTFKSAADYDLVLRLCLTGATSVVVENCFTSFRLGGISQLAEDRSNAEVCEILFKNFKGVEGVTESACKDMFYENKVSKEVYDYTLSRVHPELGESIVKSKKKTPRESNFYIIKDIPRGSRKILYKIFNLIWLLHVERRSEAKWLLFGFIPIFRIKFKRDMKKYYLFNILPVYWGQSGFDLSKSTNSNLFPHKDIQSQNHSTV